MNKIIIIMMAAAFSLSAQAMLQMMQYDDRCCSMFYFCGYADGLMFRAVRADIMNGAAACGYRDIYTNYRDGVSDAKASNVSRITNVLDYARTAEGRQFWSVFAGVMLPFFLKRGDMTALRVASRHSRLCRDLGLTNIKPLVEEMAGD